MLKIGVPKEIKTLEKRVGLTPAAVRTLCEDGHSVFVQTKAGEDSGFSDDDYLKAGARIVPDLASVYASADLIQKVKEPLFPEFSMMRANHVIFAYLHLASPDNCDLIAALQRSGATAIAYETVEVDGGYPLLAPMSEIAGALSTAYAAFLWESRVIRVSKIGSTNLTAEFERIAAKYPSFSEMKLGRTVIFGGGVAGFKALTTAIKFQAEVAVVEKNDQRREFLKQFTPQVYASEKLPKQTLEKAEVLIGCVYSHGKRAARVVNDSLLREASLVAPKIIMDISVDQGGNFAESRATTYTNPVYFDSMRNLRFGVPNIPSLCGKGASETLSRATLPYTQALAKDPSEAFRQYPELLKAVNVEDGRIRISAIADAHHK